MNGGYDEGYLSCPCFWGATPGSLVLTLEKLVPSFTGLRVLDAGCGEGKNAIFFASKGAIVDAYDISDIAISHAEAVRVESKAENVSFKASDVRSVELGGSLFDIVIAYGLMHCLPSEGEIHSLCRYLQNTLKPGGYMVLCAFNDRFQDLSAHPGFHPTILPHAAYIDLFRGWELVEAHDRDLNETHPNNNIPHTHSMTRIIARKNMRSSAESLTDE